MLDSARIGSFIALRRRELGMELGATAGEILSGNEKVEGGLSYNK